MDKDLEAAVLAVKQLNRYIKSKRKLEFGHYICRKCDSGHGKRGTGGDITNNIDLPQH